MDLSKTSYILGLDIGTTSTKAVVLEKTSKTIIFSCSDKHNADIDVDKSNFKEQDPRLIIQSMERLIRVIDSNVLRKISSIGICGQMHGVAMWPESNVTISNEGVFIVRGCANLITWEDARCDKSFIDSLPKARSNLTLSSGFGCLSLLWLTRNKPQYLRGFQCAGTIADLVVYGLAGLDKPCMSSQMAASWGYFDTAAGQWNHSILESASFPLHLLPDILENDHCLHLAHNWCGIQRGARLTMSLGDLQCAIHSCLASDTDAVLNMSTSSQLVCLMPEGFLPDKELDGPPSPVQYFPYFKHRFLAVAASLNGGNVLNCFVQMIHNWTKDLGLECSWDTIWDKLSSSGNEANSISVTISPVLFGERHDPETRASIRDISTTSLGLPDIYRSILHGLVTNLSSMMSPDFLRDRGVKRILASGSVVARNAAVLADLEREFGLPVSVKSGTDSAAGAALVAASLLENDDIS